jgi:peptidoglycan/LPS O-acetylase OafA/YrhL
VLSSRAGRLLSATGAIILAAALFATWYHIDRPSALGDPETTGWQTFHRLRLAILVGAALVLVSSIARETRPVLVGRTLLGLLLAGLIVRRIVDPPQLDYDVAPAIGVYLGALGALLVAVGGLVDSGREVIARYPDLDPWGARRPALPPGPDGGDRSPLRGHPSSPSSSDVVESTAAEM